MNANLERGILLFQQSRHEMAETELRQSLAFEPHDPYAHALLALCLSERERFQDATEEAAQAVHLGPDFPFAHYAMARVLYARNRYKEALAAVKEAIRLDSTDPDSFSLLSAIHFDQRQWNNALHAAEQGLEFDPEHIGCTNLRAMALVKLGRRAEAGATIDSALSKNPDNSLTHATQGWTYLERGEPKKALEHFRESLRLDPENEWARHGIVEALKARNIIYAIMLKYFLWMTRFSPGVQWGIILGGYFGYRLLGGIARSNPALQPWILPLQIVYVLFALMTWLANPLFNLLLRLNRFGRLALTREQTIASNWIGACLLLAVASLAACVIAGFNSPWLIATIVFGLLMLPLSGTFKCAPGWPRRVMAAYTGALAVAGIGALAVFALAGLQTGEPGKQMLAFGKGLFGLFLMGTVISLWGVNLLLFQRPRR